MSNLFTTENAILISGENFSDEEKNYIRKAANIILTKMSKDARYQGVDPKMQDKQIATDYGYIGLEILDKIRVHVHYYTDEYAKGASQDQVIMDGPEALI